MTANAVAVLLLGVAAGKPKSQLPFRHDTDWPLPPRFCDRDENVTAIWDIAAEELVWSHRTTEAVRRALAAPPPALDAPRVYVYSFPEAFANATALLGEAGLTVGDVFPEEVRAYGAPAALEYWHLVYGFKKSAFKYSRKNAWTRRRDGGLDWVPAGDMLALRARPAGAQGCSFVELHSQHVLGLVVHVGLAHSYARRVDDPNDADLFFVPDHLTVDPTWKHYDRLCAVFGTHWRRHLAAHAPRGGGASF